MTGSLCSSLDGHETNCGQSQWYLDGSVRPVRAPCRVQSLPESDYVPDSDPALPLPPGQAYPYWEWYQSYLHDSVQDGLDSLRESDEGVSGDLPPPSPDVRKAPLPHPLASGVPLRHRAWWHDRLRVALALQQVCPTGNRTTRFCTCGSQAHVEISDTDPPQYRLASETCRDRWCRPCQRERGRIIASNIIEHLDGYLPLLITLTILTADLSLRDAVAKLYRSFAALRRTVFWSSRVEGGCVVCEVKRTKDGLRWHPHLHILATSKWVPQGWLGQKWHEITGDSYIVDVRRCESSAKAGEYVAKYLDKPVHARIVRNPDYLTEAITALQGRRMVATFGTWRGVQLAHTECESGWSKLCSYRELVDRASAGETQSRRILSHLLGQHHLDPSKMDDWIRETQALHENDLLAFPALS